LSDINSVLQKSFAFMDFSTAEAAQLCVKVWNNKAMKQYPSNRLVVTPFDKEHKKLTKEERDNSKKRNHTNLFVDKLPYAFAEQDVINMFSKFGTVQ